MSSGNFVSARRLRHELPEVDVGERHALVTPRVPRQQVERPVGEEDEWALDRGGLRIEPAPSCRHLENPPDRVPQDQRGGDGRWRGVTPRAIGAARNAAWPTERPAARCTATIAHASVAHLPNERQPASGHGGSDADEMVAESEPKFGELARTVLAPAARARRWASTMGGTVSVLVGPSSSSTQYRGRRARPPRVRKRAGEARGGRRRAR